MKNLRHFLAFFALGAVALGSVNSKPLRFDKMPLGSVARVISARFHIPVMILAGAKAPVTGDFTGMDARQALTEAARQAGLTVTPLGSGLKAGFALMPPPPPNPIPPAAEADLASAARKRSELLHRREELLKEAALLGEDEPAQ